MASVDKILSNMRASPKGIRYADLQKVCDHYFGEGRQMGGAHRVYKMPWAGDPRINIQDANGKAKPYQVRQAVSAIDKLGKVQP